MLKLNLNNKLPVNWGCLSTTITCSRSMNLTIPSSLTAILSGDESVM